MQLVLASGSPRRLDLLAHMGIVPTVRPADVDESLIPGETASDYVARVARQKCSTVMALSESGVAVLAADTAVVVDGDVLGKPGDDNDAIAMLVRLSERDHQVLTAVAVGLSDEIVVGVEETTVTCGPISIDAARWYVATGEPHDKAGAYALQGAGSLFVDSIQGAPDNVVGLPRRLTASLFEQLGIYLTDFVSSRHTG